MLRLGFLRCRRFLDVWGILDESDSVGRSSMKLLSIFLTLFHLATWDKISTTFEQESRDRTGRPPSKMHCLGTDMREIQDEIARDKQ